MRSVTVTIRAAVARTNRSHELSSLWCNRVAHGWNESIRHGSRRSTTSGLRGKRLGIAATDNAAVDGLVAQITSHSLAARRPCHSPYGIQNARSGTSIHELRSGSCWRLLPAASASTRDRLAFAYNAGRKCLNRGVQKQPVRITFASTGISLRSFSSTSEENSW